jgi:hypothetical protein
MRIIGILLLLVSILGGVMGSMIVGDIGIAAFIGSIVGALSGTGFIIASTK